MRPLHLVLTLATVHAFPATAQSSAEVGYVFLAKELRQPPRVIRTTAHYYPSDRQTASARVRLQFVVDTAGHVRAGAFRTLGVNDSSFAEAARLTTMAREYKPGYLRRLPVPTLVEAEVVFKPGTVSCTETILSRSMSFCVDSTQRK